MSRQYSLAEAKYRQRFVEYQLQGGLLNSGQFAITERLTSSNSLEKQMVSPEKHDPVGHYAGLGIALGALSAWPLVQLR